MQGITPTRSVRMAGLAVLTLVALVTAGCDPIVMIPGGALSGEDVPSPADWTFTNEVDTVQLETRPDDPYSVNIWCVSVDGRLFVAGARESTWTQNVSADPRVKLRVDGKLYSLTASEMTNEGDLELFVGGVAEKYDRTIDSEEQADFVGFELTAR